MRTLVVCHQCGHAWDENNGPHLNCPACGTSAHRTAPVAPTNASDEEGGIERAPCPICGERIVKGAGKCRFCGEIFDPALRAQSIDPETIRHFRRNIHGLGGFWIFLSLLFVALGTMVLVVETPGLENRFEGDWVIIGGVCLALGVISLCVGIALFKKHLWAVYLTLVLSYLSAVCYLVDFRPISLIIAVVLILQAHRTIGLAARMRKAGIPFTTKPSAPT